MTPQERQAALDSVSVEDLAKVQSKKLKGVSIDSEDLLEAEFATKFGWLAYRDYKQDNVSTKEMMKLIVASRKLDALKQYRMALAVFIGSGAAQSSSPGPTFESLSRKLAQSAEADS